MRFTLVIMLVCFFTGCIATQGLASRSNRSSPRREGAALLGIGAAQMLIGGALTYAAIYGKSKHEPSESVTENLQEGAKDAAGRILGAIVFSMVGLGGVGDFLGGAVQTATGDYFIDPEGDARRREHLDLLRRTPINKTGNSDLDEPPRPKKAAGL